MATWSSALRIWKLLYHAQTMMTLQAGHKKSLFLRTPKSTQIPMSKEIWFIRHAQSEGNAGKRTTSSKENPLTDLGHRQAATLSDHLCGIGMKPGLLIYSDFIRTQQTMAPFVEANPDIPTEKWNIHEFTYLSAEKYNNTTVQERMPGRKEFWKKNDMFYRDDKTSESVADLVNRASETITASLKNPNDFIMVFSHGTFIKVLWMLLSHGDLDKGYIKYWPTVKKLHRWTDSISFPNTAILKVKIEGDERWLNTYHEKRIV